MQPEETTNGGYDAGARRAELTAAQVNESLQRAFPDTPRTRKDWEAATITIQESQHYLHMIGPDELRKDLPLLLEVLLEDHLDYQRRRRMIGYMIEHLNVLCLQPEEDYARIEKLMGSDLAVMTRDDDRSLAESKQKQYASFTSEQASAILDWLLYVQDRQLAAVWDRNELEAAIKYWSNRAK